MNIEHLVTMANQIGAFFRSQGGREEAVAGIADHLKRFWEPRMLRAIGLHAAAGGAGLEQDVAEAVRRVAPAAAATSSAASAARNETHGPSRKGASG
jgi:formate dehydrogenase subunit delta